MTLGVVLAAGSGSRLGKPKAPLLIDGERLVDRAVRILREGGCDDVVVVLGAWVGDVDGATVVVNPDWPSGMGSSLRAGLEAAGASAAARVLITLVDLPGLSATAVSRLMASSADAAAASYDGVRGHPAMLTRSHWRPMAQSALGDRGARVYLDSLGERLELIEVGDVASPEDIDVAADLPSQPE